MDCTCPEPGLQYDDIGTNPNCPVHGERTDAERCPTCGSVHPIYHGVKDAKKGLGWTNSKQVVCPDPFHSKPTMGAAEAAQRMAEWKATQQGRIDAAYQDGLSGAAGLPAADERSMEQAEGGPAESVTLVRAKGLRLWEEVLPEEVEAKRSDDRYEVRTFVQAARGDILIEKSVEGEAGGEAVTLWRWQEGHIDTDWQLVPAPDQAFEGELETRTFVPESSLNAALARAEAAEKKASEMMNLNLERAEEAERERDALGEKLGGMKLDRNAERRMRKDAESVIERVREYLESLPVGEYASKNHLLSLLNPKESE